MKKNILLILVVSGLIIAGCSSGTVTSPFKFGKGTYKFTMSDSTGAELLRGSLIVLTYADGKISGTYEFTKISDRDFPGFSSMQGEFSGDVSNTEKTVFINTNPRIADSNVFWNLKIKNNSLSGNWNYSVFRGKTSGGKVKITK